MTLQQLADKSGLTPSSISQLERGKTTGSIKTLKKIAEELGITVSDLFADEADNLNSVISFAHRTTHDYGTRASKALVTPKTFNHVEVFVGHLEAGGNTGSEPHTHGSSEEVIVVLEGSVDVTIGQQVFPLVKNQSIALSSNQPHKVEETGGKTAMVMWIIAPPSV